MANRRRSGVTIPEARRFSLIEWQRDFFDFGHVAKMFGALIQSGDLSTGMQKRIERSLAGEQLPGYYPLGQAPVPIW